MENTVMALRERRYRFELNAARENISMVDKVVSEQTPTEILGLLPWVFVELWKMFGPRVFIDQKVRRYKYCGPNNDGSTFSSKMLAFPGDSVQNNSVVQIPEEESNLWMPMKCYSLGLRGSPIILGTFKQNEIPIETAKDEILSHFRKTLENSSIVHIGIELIYCDLCEGPKRLLCVKYGQILTDIPPLYV